MSSSFFFVWSRRPPIYRLFPYTTLFRSIQDSVFLISGGGSGLGAATARLLAERGGRVVIADVNAAAGRSEEHTSVLQSRRDLVCRLLLEKKKKNRVRTALDTWTRLTTDV